ncbi:MAG: 6-phosphogluconolactonase [Chthoniobacterales bacterium]
MEKPPHGTQPLKVPPVFVPTVVPEREWVPIQTRKNGFRPKSLEKPPLRLTPAVPDGEHQPLILPGNTRDSLRRRTHFQQFPSMSDILHTTKFVDAATQHILNHAARAIVERGRFFLALSGGSTPKAIYQKLADIAPDTSRWVITFGDERCVPPDHAQSNFKMAHEAWLYRADATVLRIKAELDPAAAAQDYEAQLDAFPDFRHDLILLGMGDDGHTASLFPGSEGLQETQRRVIANFVPSLGVWRITLTFPFINAARSIVFLVNGKSKQSLVESILRGGTDYPSERITPTDGQLLWLLGE